MYIAIYIDCFFKNALKFVLMPKMFSVNFTIRKDKYFTFLFLFMHLICQETATYNRILDNVLNNWSKTCFYLSMQHSSTKMINYAKMLTAGNRFSFTVLFLLSLLFVFVVRNATILCLRCLQSSIYL